MHPVDNMYFYFYFPISFSRISISNSIFKLSTINTVSRRQIPNVCTVGKSDWLHPRKIRERELSPVCAPDALLPLVSIHDRRSPRTVDLFPDAAKKRKKKRRHAKKSWRENTERCERMRGIRKNSDV